MDKINRKPIFDAVRIIVKRHSPSWLTYSLQEVNELDAAIDLAVVNALPVPPTRPAAPLIPDPQTSSTAEKAEMGFVLGSKSLERMKPIHPKLGQCILLAIKYSMVDFRVNQVERTQAQQLEYFRKGTTRTMKSKHLRQPDGKVWAADLVALVNGEVSWDFDCYYYIARAMDKAATELGIADHIRWGAVWDRVLADFGTEANGDKVAIRKAYLKAIEEYKVRHKGNDFLDGPHFEWVP